MTSNHRGAAFFDLDQECYPLRITWYRGTQIAHVAEIDGPGALVVPTLGKITRCVVECADGTVGDWTP